MEISAQIKIAGDEYSGFYSCGLTMQDSESMRRMQTVSDTDKETVLLDDRGVELRIYHEARGVEHPSPFDGKPVHMRTVVTNKGDVPVTLEMANSFSVSRIKADKIHRLRSFWSAEGRLKTDDVKELNLEHSWNHMAYRIEKFGTVGTMPVRQYFPFVALEDSSSGRFTAFQLYSPSSWQMEIICRHDECLTVAGGIADRDFGAFTKVLRPGESLETPKTVMATGASLEEVCELLVKAQHPDISPVDDSMGIIFNEYCATWGNPNEENMKKVCDAVAGKGIQYLVMDSGWYGKEGGYWWDNTGDWKINPVRFPKGLKPVADYIRSKGMIPGIWFEFENLGPNAPLFHQPEYVVKKDGVPLTVGGRRTLDMENSWVQNYLKEAVIDFLKDNGFGYIKVDYNDTFGLGCDGPDGLGENLRKKILASQKFFRRMKEEIPELVIENCSSGGHRLEPSMMELASMASFSDAHEIPSLPIIAANMHRMILPEQNQVWAVFRKEDSDARLHYSVCAAFFGRMGLSGDIYDISDHQWKVIEDGMDFYKQVAGIIKDGFTSLLVCNADSYNEPKGGQLVVRSLGDKTLAVYHRFADSVDLKHFVEQEGLTECVKLPTAKAVTYGAADCDFSAMAWVL